VIVEEQPGRLTTTVWEAPSVIMPSKIAVYFLLSAVVATVWLLGPSVRVRMPAAGLVSVITTVLETVFVVNVHGPVRDVAVKLQQVEGDRVTVLSV
jgi:hypothetical protein